MGDAYHDVDVEDSGRLYIVANRLPVSITQKDDGTYDFHQAPGGLASSLTGLGSEVNFRWFGWPGIEIHRNDKDEVRKQLQDNFGAVPVFLPASLAEKHYNGFSNSVLWPLLHGMPEKASTDSSWSEAFREVNETFADALIPHLEDNDTVWIHDYHLLLLPSALRRRLRRQKKVRIGFFLHTPFPREDQFSILPFREIICEGVFNCDVVGFHTIEYVNDFLNSAEKVLSGVERSPHDLHYKGRKMIVHNFPIGIDPASFHTALQLPETKKELCYLENFFKDKKVLISVDRLDYIKGIPQKLLAFDRFLTDHPDWIGKVVLIQLAVPSRQGVDEYTKLQHEVERLVGHVNGKHSTISYTPVVFLHRSMPFNQLCALYAVADGCIVSSLRDGLNLVAYEYVVSQSKKASDGQKGPGILLLSQYTGAAATLKSALIFNPWDRPRFADGIFQALQMDAAERMRRHEDSAEVVEAHTSARWGRSFLRTLETLRVDDDEQPAGQA